MCAEELHLSCAVFSSLVEAAGRDCNSVWLLLSEMKQSGVKPNQAICLQALKCAHRSSKSVDYEKALAVVGELGDAAMTEAILSAICEAGIQTSSYHLLVEQIRRYWES